MNYKIEDFTLDNYRGFLEEAKQKYIFSGFDETPPAARHILLRHDLDLSVPAAHEVAVAEAELGVKATYFLLMHSPFYNLFDIRNVRLIREIKNMGHHIGLHFDSHFYDIVNEEELNQSIEKEKNILNDLFEVDIKVFSFHLTNAFTMNCKNPSYGGLVNVYSRTFQDDYAYCSDSYGVWRYNRLFDFIHQQSDKNLHILTHPEWWVHQPSMPSVRIGNIIDAMVKQLLADADRHYIYKETTQS